MDQVINKYIHESFTRLMSVYGFKVKTEMNEGQSYKIEYCFGDFVIKVEKYYRELYTTLYKNNIPNSEVNMFNLLDYLIKDNHKVPTSEYFRDEKDVLDSYRKQITYITNVVYDNIDLLKSFFCEDNYELRKLDFDAYWKKKYPELYK